MVFFGTAGAVLALVLIAVVVVVSMSGGEDDAAAGKPTSPMGRPADSGPAPSSYSNSPSTDAYAAIDRRRADPRPLTADETFPASARTLTATEAKAKLTLQAKRLDGDCAQAIWGAAVGDELRRGGCTQALRGVYSDQKKGYALSVTVLNLAGVEDANRAVDALGRGRGGGFVRPLSAKAPLNRFGQGFSMARGLAMGHYAVIAWAQRLDGKGDEQDEALLSLLIEGGKAAAVLSRAARAR